MPKATSQSGREGAERSKSPILALLLIYLAFLLLHVAFVAHRIAPLIYPDELGFWSHARVLLGEAPPTDPALLKVYGKYYPAYSFLLVPCIALTSSTLSAYKAALFVNCILLAAVPLLAYRLVRALAPGLTNALHLAIGCMVGSYPTYLLYAELTLAEALIVPSVVLLLVGAERVLAKPTLARFAGLGFCAGALVLVHRRLVVVAIAVLLCAAAWRGTRRFVPLAGALLGVALALPLANWCVNLISFPAQLDIAHVEATRTLSSLADEGRQASRLWDTTIALSGHLFYLCIATYGLFVLGMLRATQAIIAVLRRRSCEPRDGLAALCGLVVLVALPTHAFYLNDLDRLDYLLNGRYNEGVLAPILALGIVCVAEQSRSWRSAGIALAAIFAVAGASLGWLLAFARADVVELPNEPVENLALYPVLSRSIDGAAMGSLVALVVAVAGLLLLAWRSSRPLLRVAAVGMLSMGFVGTAIVTSRSYFGPGTIDRYQQAAMVPFLRLVADQPERPTIAVDRAVMATWEHAWHVFNYDFFVDCDFRAWRGGDEELPGAVLITRRPDVQRRFPGAKLAGMEAGARLFVWVLPGELQRRLESRWVFLPKNFARRLSWDDGERALRLHPFNTVGMYADHGWTNGRAIVSHVGYDLQPDDRFLELRTHGLRLSAEAVDVTILVDGRRLSYSHAMGTSYYYALPPTVRRIDEIHILSSTFVPADSGSADTRRLGIDVAAIAFVPGVTR